ncbi:hypothetical protein [Sodalis sp. RH19]|uniref:hypothetical protein n=1 Tax=Sodalis sp. RH19 TaxID=3394334 RepID=UPI0039B522A8
MNAVESLLLFLSPRRTAGLWLLCALTACACRVSAAGGETLAIPTADGAMRVYLYRPMADARDMPVVMVLHGVKRDGAQARDQWIAAANHYHFLIIAPEFPGTRYPGARGYMLGNTAAGPAVLPAAQWSYSRIGDVFNALRREGITRRSDYLLYGHSAGCQFVHRMLMALPDMPARAVVCASAGWWTPPDPRRSWPYGLARAPFTLDAAQEARFFARPTLIMVGEQDRRTRRTAMRNTPQAQAQGKNRLERAGWYFRRAQSLAEQQKMPFHWQFISVSGAGHQSPLLVDEAARFLNQFK